MSMKKTLFSKIWDKHVVEEPSPGMFVLYIDRHFIHEVTSPQAFSGLKQRGVSVFRKDLTTATADHNVPTLHQQLPILDQLSREQVELLRKNCATSGIELFDLGNPNNGIVHVIGPELGLTRPGTTIVCGDSHTSTHGAFGAIAFGIGTSEVEQVLASQCLFQSLPKQMRITIDGKLRPGVLPKDLILHIISKLGHGGATGFFIEFAGETIREMSMTGRMTICNMSIEMGARGGLIAPDKQTEDWFSQRNLPVKTDEWKDLHSDGDAKFDQEIVINASEIQPMITYGTNPGMGISIQDKIPSSTSVAHKKALDYMGFKEGEVLVGKKVNYVFIGSCTNARFEDLKVVAEALRGKQKAKGMHVYLVPGSNKVLDELKRSDLIQVFENAGILVREPGCSACLGMNEDKIPAGEYCVSTSNRNFEGRQGPGARTILASPLTAAATILTGVLSDPRTLIKE